MKRLTLLAVLAFFGCPSPEPELETRNQVPTLGTEQPETPPDITNEDNADAGPFEFDAGLCCPVTFRVAASNYDFVGDLVFLDRNRALPLELDAGVWFVTECMPLRRTRYYYQMGLRPLDPGPDDDGGVFPEMRVNGQAPTEVSGLGLVNIFDSEGAQVCSELDAGVHAAIDVADGG